MKYTRYDLKANKKKNEWKNMPVMIIGVCILAIVIGTLLFKLISPKLALNDKTKITKEQQPTTEQNNSNNNSTGDGNKATPPVTNEQQKEQEKNEEKPKEEVVGEKEEFLTAQLGYYSSKESAESIVKEVGNKAFVIKDGDKYRVIGYIGKEEKTNKYIESLKGSNVESSKGRFSITTAEKCDKKVVEIFNGLIDILDKANDGEVKGINTKEFKEWANNLEECKDCTTFNKFTEIKSQINKLPESISKDNINESYQMLFDMLNKYK